MFEKPHWDDANESPELEEYPVIISWKNGQEIGRYPDYEAAMKGLEQKGLRGNQEIIIDFDQEAIDRLKRRKRRGGADSN